jgi:hypothetical protein
MLTRDRTGLSFAILTLVPIQRFGTSAILTTQFGRQQESSPVTASEKHFRANRFSVACVKDILPTGVYTYNQVVDEMAILANNSYRGG